MANTITKNQTAEIPTKSGNKYSYQYVDIAQIHDYLESVDASYIQCVDRLDGDDYIMTKRYLNGEWETEWLRGARIVNATLMGNNNPAQEQGSAITYARRYSLLMAFGLATEDDDAQSLSKVKIPSQEDAENYVFQFGKCKGKLLKDIVKEDASYIDWLIGNSNDDYLLKCIELLTGQVKPTEDELKTRLELLAKFNSLVIQTGTDSDELYTYYGVENNTKMTNEQFKDAINILEKKLNKSEVK